MWRECGQRLAEIAPRLDIGQLAGGVGSLSSLGVRALEVQKHFLEKLGLNAPIISWTTSRDTLAEWCNLLALIAATGDKIGHEVYNLQRAEIGEVSEGFVTGTVGSITMPHKRNPEISEHLGTLARLIRHNAALMLESLVHDHERDGRSWKVEWPVVAETCMLSGKLLALLGALTGNLDIHAERIGKQSAHTLVYETAMAAHSAGRSFKEAVLDNPQIRAQLTGEEIAAIFDYQQQTGQCVAMVDQVLAELRSSNEPG